MKFVRVSLAVSTLVFLTGVWFVVSTPQRQTPSPAAPPVATVRQLMLGLVIPASQKIYDAAGTVSTLEGTVERAPKDDREWEIVGANAALLIEAAALLTAEGRSLDDPVWTSSSDDLAAGARSVLEAVKAKSVDGLLEKGGEIVAACDRCHEKFLPGAR